MSRVHRTFIAALVAATALAILAVPTSVDAYEFICRGWRVTGYEGSCPVGYQESDQCGCDTPSTAPKWYGAQLTMRVENQGGNGVTAAQFIAAAQSAAQSWTNVSGSNMVLNASQTFSATNSPRWGSFNNLSDEHEVFFVTSNSEWIQVTGSGAGGTLGVTVSPWSSWGCNDRGFYDTDVLINGFIQGGWTASWIESVLLHEMGHSIGLGHPCLVSYLGCSNSCAAVMAATGADYVTPQQDDVNGISALYPGIPGGLGSACTSSSQCTGGRPCINYQGFRYCSEYCTGTCPTGYVCRTVDSNDVCVRRGAPAVGEACTAQCEPGATCLYDVSGGICRADCDPNNDNCTGGARCVPLQGGSGACFPAGSAQQGEVCVDFTDCAAGLICLGDPTGGPSTCWRQCDPLVTGDCGEQSMCIELDPTTGYCIPAVGVGEDCLAAQCFPGLICIGTTTLAECYRDCTGDPSICVPGESCEVLSDNTTYACFQRGTADEGDRCMAPIDCLQGLTCVGAGFGAECLYECNPQNPSCPLPGQTCITLSGSEGACDPAGGFDCTCDTNEACVGLDVCFCDQDCPCTCDTTERCDVGCNCDPECYYGCTCDTVPGCESGCSCDPDCASTCVCDTGPGCEAGCTCDPACAACSCDISPACDPTCSCDGDCPCSCDSTTRCDVNCSCDIECYVGCTCDTTPACQSNCGCDGDCTTSCMCDVTSACDAGCSCDPNCNAVCGCDVSLSCDAGCSCDIDCPTTCTCDLTTGCDAGCVCDPVCQAGCSCNIGGLCEAECACDPDCPNSCACDLDPNGCDGGCDCDTTCTVGCTCDTGPGCDDGCTCDRECMGCPCDTNVVCTGGCTCDGDCDRCPCDTSLECEEDCPCDYSCDCWCDLHDGLCDPDTNVTEGYAACACDTADCPCECDTSYSCNDDCACDLDCLDTGSGCNCSGSSSGFGVLLVLLLPLLRRRRRA